MFILQDEWARWLKQGSQACHKKKQKERKLSEQDESKVRLTAGNNSDSNTAYQWKIFKIKK